MGFTITSEVKIESLGLSLSNLYATFGGDKSCRKGDFVEGKQQYVLRATLNYYADASKSARPLKQIPVTTVITDLAQNEFDALYVAAKTPYDPANVVDVL